MKDSSVATLSEVEERKLRQNEISLQGEIARLNQNLKRLDIVRCSDPTSF